jgi:TRAP-type C4-dicarboxylate transport system substrate-binding protein
VSLFAYGPSSVGTRKPVRHLAEFKGLKLRVLASPFQNELVSRMGGTPIAMTLGDVLPALQQGAIDGTISAMPVFTTMHYYDAAKYVTDTGQPFIFSVAEISKKWFDSLPADLQKIVTDEGAKTGKAIEPWALKFFAEQRKAWTANGGELIQLPAAEQAEFIKRISNIGDDMSKSKPGLNEAFKSLAAAVAKAK